MSATEQKAALAVVTGDVGPDPRHRDSCLPQP